VDPGEFFREIHSGISPAGRHATWQGKSFGVSRLNRTPDAFRTEAEAADWLVRLDADNSALTRAQFQKWLAADARHRAVYLRLEKSWREADRLKDLRPLDGSVNVTVLDTFPGARTVSAAYPLPETHSAFMYRAILAALALTVIVVAAWLFLMRSEWQVYRTELGGFQRLVLRDGSTALLNTNSEMRVRITARHREIVLARGEVLFNVAHDDQCPFDVEAGDTTVRAVGTSFTVRVHDRRHIEVLVAQGSVAINPPSSSSQPSSVLSAKEAVTISANLIHVEHMDADDITHRLAWTRGRLWFKQNTLAEAAAEFNRYNRRQLAIADPAIASLRIGGIFDATDPDAFVAALEQVFAIRVLPSGKDDSGSEVIWLVGETPPG
jgi:transmembrane sensor